MTENPNIIDLDDFPKGANFKTINQTSLIGQGNINLQQPLISGTNIKSINANSLLGEGDVNVQQTLVSGTNIKTVNNTSLLGGGNIDVQPTLISGTNIKTISGNSILGSGDIQLSTGHTVTTTYKSSSSWYRVWSDGWIEQGGTLTPPASFTSINFPKAFSDTNYSFAGSLTDENEDANCQILGVYNRQTNSIRVANAYNGTFYTGKISWYACGY